MILHWPTVFMILSSTQAGLHIINLNYRRWSRIEMARDDSGDIMSLGNVSINGLVYLRLVRLVKFQRL